jgi:hypothetical protein
LLAAVSVAVALAFGGAALASKAYWGYCFTRPGLDRQILQATAVRSATLFTARDEGSRPLKTFRSNPNTNPRELLRNAPANPYYCLDQRVLLALDDRGLLPGNPPSAAPEKVERVYDLLLGSNTLEADLYLTGGVLVEATGAEGEELLFVGLGGWTRDYDHRAYYEYLFSRTTPSAEFQFLSCNHFYFDMAGLEGLEWPQMFVALLVVFVPLAVVGATVFLLVAAAVRRSQGAGGGPVRRETSIGVADGGLFGNVEHAPYLLEPEGRLDGRLD